MKIRLMFEPKPGVYCNVPEMFRCYAENYLSDFPQLKYAGYIVVDAKRYKHHDNAANEPMYQFLAVDCDEGTLTELTDYTKTNPMHGYELHIDVGLTNQNEQSLEDYLTTKETQ
jgi:hypothetical protein